MAQQIKPTFPKKKVIHMACRHGCGSNDAFLVMKIAIPMVQGGGTIFTYRCCGCGKKFIFTR